MQSAGRPEPVAGAVLVGAFPPEVDAEAPVWAAEELEAAEPDVEELGAEEPPSDVDADGVEVFDADVAPVAPEALDVELPQPAKVSTAAPSRAAAVALAAVGRIRIRSLTG
ncbi:hypothetical protein [Catenulispora yoronensis]|uniref:hypothetical protein n=1 Tax=Catenulispora yoronensis TaxID=450799 RepID=UPI0031D366F8